MNFGTRLKELRLEKGLTLDDLKDKLETTKATLSRYENNQREPKADFVDKTSRLFGVSIDYMMGKSNLREIINLDASDVLREALTNIQNKENCLKYSDKTINQIKTLLEIGLDLIRSEKDKNNLI